MIETLHRLFFPQDLLHTAIDFDLLERVVIGGVLGGHLCGEVEKIAEEYSSAFKVRIYT